MTTSRPALLERFLALPAELTPADIRAFVDEVSAKHANAFAWTIRKHLGSLSGDELATLVRAFTLLENELKSDFCGGSTSQVPALLHELKQRDPARAEELTSWAFVVAENPYNPFGTFNASRTLSTSVGDYRRMETARFAQARSDDELRSTASKQRAEERRRRHEVRLVDHTDYNERRRTYLAELAKLTPEARLRSVAVHVQWRLGAIPKAFADAAAVETLGPDERLALIARLARAPRGPWASLQAKLHGATIVMPTRRG